MTKEDAIKELSYIADEMPSMVCRDWKVAIYMAIKALEQTGWVPVSERLPRENRAVLTYIDTGVTKTYCLAYWNDVREAWEEWIGYDLIEKDKGYKVIAWMPLPEPYKAEREG